MEDWKYTNTSTYAITLAVGARVLASIAASDFGTDSTTAFLSAVL